MQEPGLLGRDLRFNLRAMGKHMKCSEFYLSWVILFCAENGLEKKGGTNASGVEYMVSQERKAGGVD